jgi:site-specific DNA recombinase
LATTGPTPQRKRAVIYCRVSTDRQEVDGESLDYQEAKCRQYAELHDIDVVLVLQEAKSGYIHYSFREKLGIARQFIRDRLAEVIIVWDLRRFSRNFVHSAMIFEEIESNGGQIISVSENIDNSLTGKLIRSILAWSAESEREKILEYANRRWQQRLAAGLPVGSGYIRYGWAWGDEDKTFYVLNHEEAAVRFSIFHMYVELDMSLRAIAHKLTEDGIPTPTQKRWPGSKKGKVWQAMTVYDFLTDPANIGTLIICKKKRVLGPLGKIRKVLNPDMKVILNGLPPIVSQNLYDRAQRKLAINQVEKSHTPKDPELHLLRGYAFCGSCGYRMCTRVYKGVPYYYCSNRHNKYDSCPDIPAVRADLVDLLAWQECCALFERIDAIHTQLSREIERAVTELLEDTTGREHITELEALIDYAKEERSKHAEGSYMHTLITQDLSTKEEQLRRFKAECTSAGTVAATTAMYQARALDFLEFLNVMHGQYDTASFQEKRNALDVLGIKVRLAALPEEQRKRGKIPAAAEIRARMSITYSPLFTGVQSSDEGLPQNQ